jgi:hypothetical protein
MRLFLCKIIFSIHLNQQYLLQNNIPLTQHTWPSEFSTPHSRSRSQLMLGCWWRRFQPSERCQMYENDSSWLSVLILGRSKITRWQMWGLRSLQKHGNNTFTKNSRIDNAICACSLSWWRIQWTIILFELTSPSFSDSPGLQDSICDLLWHKVVQILYELPR